VNELLDISRLERGKLTVSTQPVDLVTMTREVLAETDVLVQERRHRVSVSTGDHPLPAVRADAQLLRQVVMNLVSNAIKYTPEGGAIEVRFERDGDTLRWSIRDSGIGIPRSSQARLFEKFYRAAEREHARDRGHRPRALPRAPDHGAARRPRLVRVGGGRGLDLPLHAAARGARRVTSGRRVLLGDRVAGILEG
jgi:signal transduction histidine kinase